MMRNNGKLIAKVLEISSTEVKYKRFDNLDGPNYVINKTEVSSITYSNGLKDVFEATKINSNADNIFINPIPPKGSEKRETKIGDYIKFNAQAGAIIHNKYCNKPRDDHPYTGHTIDESYSGFKKNNLTNNLNLGINFLFGKSQFVKHIIGINYLRSKGEFDYEYSSISHTLNTNMYSSRQLHFHYKSTVDYINVISGIRFTILKHINIEPQVAINFAVKTQEKITGAITTSTFSTSQNPNYYYEEIEYINNKNVSTKYRKTGSTISFCPKVSYDFSIKQKKTGIYIAYNLSYYTSLPWWMFGVTYYPFKKLR